MLTACGSSPHASQPQHQAATITPRQVVLVVDGAQQSLTTTATTVQAVLDQAGVKLGKYDRVVPSVATATPAQIQVTHLVSRTRTRTVVIKMPVKSRKDHKLAAWTTKIAKKGHPGKAKVVSAFAMRKGKRKRIVLSRTVLKPAVAQVLKIGPQPSSAGGAVAKLNWAGVADCESHGNPRAVNAAGYYGLYQFSVASWASVGGTGLPSNAPAAEQTYRAQLLYLRVNGRWQGQWPNCGSRL